MEPKVFTREDFSKDAQGNCSVRSNPVLLRSVHTHENRFEFFVCIQGSANHLINGQTQFLSEGTIAFVRPSDVHGYTDPMSNDFQIINFAVDSDIVMEALDYIQFGPKATDMLTSALSPITWIAKKELQILKNKLENLMFVVERETIKVRPFVRVLFIEMLTNYFLVPQIYCKPNVPAWIESLINEMYKPENYTKGINIMTQITRRSHPHIAREIKKYLGKTPTQIVNEIRLEEAARQLTYTDNKVIDICENVGFENLSHFNHEFKKNYAMSPLKFRTHTRKFDFL